jgi:hypothetical protein
MDSRQLIGRVHLVPKFIRPIKSTTLSPAQLAALYCPLLEQQAAASSGDQGSSREVTVVKKWTIEGLGSSSASAVVLAELLARGLHSLPALEELRVQRCSLDGSAAAMQLLQEGLASHASLVSLQVCGPGCAGCAAQACRPGAAAARNSPSCGGRQAGHHQERLGP